MQGPTNLRLSFDAISLVALTPNNRTLRACEHEWLDKYQDGTGETGK